MAGNTVQVTITAKDHASPVMKDIEGNAGKMGGALGGVAKIAGGFVLAQGILKAPGFLMDAAKAAAEDEQATARLSQTVKNLGGDYDGTMKKVNEAIKSGQKLAFTDDEVRDSFQYLAQATNDSDEALLRQKAAMDLSRGANIPLTMATKLLGKMNVENVDTFKKLGIEMSDTATEAEALANVQKRFAGQSETYAKSTAGQFQQLKIRMGEAKETLGAALLPVMIQLGDILMTKIVPAMERFAETAGPGLKMVGESIKLAFGFLLDNWELVVGAITGIAVAMLVHGVVGLVAWSVAANAAGVSNIALAASTVLALAPYILIALAVAALVAGIIILVQHWDDVVARFPALGGAADGVKQAFDAFIDWITGPFVAGVQGIVTAVSGAITAAIAYVREHWGTIQAIIEPAIEAVKLIIKAGFDLVVIYIETAIGVIRGIVQVFVGVFTGDWQRVKDGVLQIVGSLKDGAVEAISTMIDLILGLAPLILAAGKALGSALLDGLKEALSATAGFAGDVGTAVLAAVKHVINTYVIGPLNSALNFTIPVPGFKDIPINAGKIPTLAVGARNFRGGLAIVGEAGPELVDLPGGANVYTNRESAGMLGGAGHGGVTVVVNLAPGAYIQDMDGFVADLKRELGRATA